VFGCERVTVTTGDPVGKLDVARATADVVGVRVSGWALDPDGAGSSTVVVRVAGAEAGRVVADRSRPDVASAFTGHSAQRGFDVVVPGRPPVLAGVAPSPSTRARRRHTQLGCPEVDCPSAGGRDAARRASVADSCPAASRRRLPRPPRSACPRRRRLRRLRAADRRRHRRPLRPHRPAQPAARSPAFLPACCRPRAHRCPTSPRGRLRDDRGSPHERAINQMAALGVVGGKGARRYDPSARVARPDGQLPRAGLRAARRGPAAGRRQLVRRRRRLGARDEHRPRPLGPASPAARSRPATHRSRSPTAGRWRRS
jgi:hypothetical protein